MGTSMGATFTSKPLGASPGALAFGRGMLLPTPAAAGPRLARARRQTLAGQASLRESQRRRSHGYAAGGQLLAKAFKPSALQERWHGPFTITQAHSSGTASYMLSELVAGRASTRRAKPCSTAR